MHFLIGTESITNEALVDFIVNFLSTMLSKGPEKPYSRQDTVWDYCGTKISRHNLKTHTDNAHPGKKVVENPSKQKSLLEMVGAPPTRWLELQLMWLGLWLLPRFCYPGEGASLCLV